MNERISANEFRDSIDRYLSGMKADPGLAQRIIASEKGKMKMKKKLSVSLALIAALLLALTATAFAVTVLYRVVNWQGEVTRTVDPAQTPVSDTEQAANQERFRDSLYSFMSEIPDDETAFAWYDGDDGSIQCSELHETQIQFSSVGEFAQCMSGIRHLSVPVWLPEENAAHCSGKIRLECKAFGKYDLVKNGQSGSMHYNRFLIDDSSAVAMGYDLGLTLEDGLFFIVRSELRESASDEPFMLRAGETAKKVAVRGMTDALLITSEDPAYPDGLAMRRKLGDPVRLKQLPLNDKLEESDDRYYRYEYVTVWGYNLNDPEILLKLFSAEQTETE